MPIRVVCKHCGKKFSAWDDLIGKSVQCPKCQQQMVVHSGNDALDEKPTPSKATPPLNAEKLGSKKSSPKKSAPLTRPTAPSPTAAPSLPKSSSNANNTSDDFDDSDELPYACPHCSQAMPPDEDLCDHCGYHRILKRRIDVNDGIDKPDKSVGFERLFKGQLTDADSAESTLLYMKIIGGVLAAVFIIVCHPWSWFVALAIIVGFFVYRSKRSSPKNDLDESSAVNQDIASSFLWIVGLNVQRAIGWRVAEWPFPTTIALTLHDSTFTDDDLNEVENLTKYETLDLEGTQLSNAGIQQLECHKQLRYVVVRKTNVTFKGVQRLQQALPKVCIWY